MNIQEAIRNFLKRHTEKRRWLKIVFSLGVVVSLITTAMMTLPARAQTGVLVCEKEEHSHTDECYEKVPAAIECAYAEKKTHLHDDSCYTEESVLVCEEDHEHTDECYETRRTLTCDKEEFVLLHTHDENCYDSEGNLICSLEEHKVHVHDASCYDENGELICTEREVRDHPEHTEECYETDEEGNRVLICDLPLTETHQHTEECIVPEHEVLICDREEHTHTDECYDSSKETVEAFEAEQEEITAEDDNTVVFEGTAGDVRVTVKADKDAFPEGTVMTVTPVSSEDVMDTVTDTLGGKQIVTVKAVDITFWNNDEEVEPAKPISVSMSSDPVEKANESAVIHIDNEGTADIVAEADNAEEEMTFAADSFSVYVMTYTVDFEYEINGSIYTFSMTGGDAVSFRELVKTLHLLDGTDKDVDTFMSDIRNIEFSDPELVSIVQVTNNSSLNAIKQQYELECEYPEGLTQSEIDEMNAKVFNSPDWVLVSLKPFSTPESITVTMKKGEVFTINVTDEQLETDVLTADGRTYNIKVIYDENAGIPNGSRLNVTEIDENTAAYDDYLGRSLETLGMTGGSAAKARFFDIKIVYDGLEIEPYAPVNVEITLKDSIAADGDNSVIHFGEYGPEYLKSEESAAKNTEEVKLTFRSGSFSIYAVITDPMPSLDGKSFIMSRGGRYVTSTVNTDLNPDRLNKTNNKNQAATWTFEANGSGYNVYTMVDGNKRYLNMNRMDGNNANVTLSNNPQVFDVNSEDNGTFSISRISNGTRYYLNEFGDEGGQGFAGWNADNGGSHLTLEFTSFYPVPGDEYMVIVKYNDKYYIVDNEVGLEEVEYDTTTNKLKIDDPMMWSYDGSHLYFHVRETGFNPNRTASDFYRRYLDADQTDGYIDESDQQGNPARVALRDNGDWWNPQGQQYEHNTTVIDRSQALANTAIAFEDYGPGSDGYKIHSGNSYLGIVVDSDGHPSLAGNASSQNAAEIFFASLSDMDIQPNDSNSRTMDWVNHIDIAILATSNLNVDLAYGDYSYIDPTTGQRVTFTVDADNEVELNLSQKVDIEESDIENASIRAYIKDEATGKQTDLDNAFYITGYSGNAKTELGEAQVRVEGVFKVADNWPEGSTGNNDRPRNHRIYYELSTNKTLTYQLLYDHDNNPATPPVQLYDANGTELSVNSEFALSAGFDYWDEGNECPAVHNGQAFLPDWNDGWVVNVGSSGMDFVLGSGDENDRKVVAIEITKFIKDEDGNNIEVGYDTENKFNIYLLKMQPEDRQDYSDTNNPKTYTDTVYQLNQGSYTQPFNPTEHGYTEYVPMHGKTVSVSEHGVGSVYDYAVDPGMIYVEEDTSADSLLREFTDADGNVWSFDHTRIETEYVWRESNGSNARHYSKDYTLDDSDPFRSIPEVLGYYYANEIYHDDVTGEDTKTAFNGFLEFYVYNIYKKNTELNVEKVWASGDPPAGTEVTVDLYYALDDADGNFPSSYDSYLPVADDPLFAGVTAQIVLKEDTTDPSKSWKGVFEELPEKVTGSDGEIHSVDYYAKETRVIQRTGTGETDFVDITHRYTSAGEKGTEEGTNGKVTITNTPRPDLLILKVDKEDPAKKLAGAKFELQYWAEDTGTYVAANSIDEINIEGLDNSQFVVPENGFTLKSLPDGKYRLKEISAPDGHVVLDEFPVYFTVENGVIANGTETVADVTFTAATSTAIAQFTIPNPPGAPLPHTGGIGTYTYQILGGLLIMLGVILLRIRRKKGGGEYA